MMMRKIKLILVSAIFAMAALTPVLAVSTANAQVSQSSKDAACEGLGAGTGNACTGGAGNSVGKLVATAVSILSWIVGVISVIMVLVGGLKFITANGDSSKITSARSTIIYALIGIAIAVSAQVLINFVVSGTKEAAATSLPGFIHQEIT